MRAARGMRLRLLVAGAALAAMSASRVGADTIDAARPSVEAVCDDLPSADALLPVLNAWRAQGAACGAAGTFGVAVALTWNDRLAQTAVRQARAVALQQRLSHRIDGDDLGARLHAANYATVRAAENLASGLPTLAAAAAEWMTSAPHCANLMAPRLREAGVGCAVSLGADGTPVRYWALVMGEPRAMAAALRVDTLSASR